MLTTKGTFVPSVSLLLLVVQLEGEQLLHLQCYLPMLLLLLSLLIIITSLLLAVAQLEGEPPVLHIKIAASVVTANNKIAPLLVAVAKWFSR